MTGIDRKPRVLILASDLARGDVMALVLAARHAGAPLEVVEVQSDPKQIEREIVAELQGFLEPIRETRASNVPYWRRFGHKRRPR
ncbi:MAG: hypothetical protein ACRET2_08975 [Steroidobacteraceae bacterium]